MYHLLRIVLHNQNVTKKKKKAVGSIELKCLCMMNEISSSAEEKRIHTNTIFNTTLLICIFPMLHTPFLDPLRSF